MRECLLALFLAIALSSVTSARDLSAPLLQIKDARVASERAARHVAFSSYVEKMRLNVSATEGARKVAIIRLGYDMPQFASRGEQLWEVRVLTLEGELRAILWVNPKTEDVAFVAGPWIGDTESASRPAANASTKQHGVVVQGPVHGADDVETAAGGDSEGPESVQGRASPLEQGNADQE